MKRTNLLLLGLAFAVAFVTAAAPAQAGSSVSVNLRIGDPYRGAQIAFTNDPDIEVVPDTRVYYIRNYDYDMFRYGRFWYVCNDDGMWFRGRAYRGPFFHVGLTTVPRAVVMVPDRYRGHWRDNPGRGNAYGHYKQDDRRDGMAMDRGHGNGHGNRGRGHGNGRGDEDR